ncbi:hypothetical protein E4U41_003025, partial [Claviceps citrina]
LDQVLAEEPKSGGLSSAVVLRDDDGNETVVDSEKDLRERLEALSSFQLTLLLHAFRFPRARKVTYSTCSVHAEENEHVVVAALRSDIAREAGWRILPREDQVSGMRAWPVRGLVQACDGDEAVAEACIRTYKGDGRGVMGFFVAAFARDPDGRGCQEGEGEGEEEEEEEEEDDDGPYVRDDGGAIVRDMLGMPVLKATGVPVALISVDGGGGGGGGGHDGRADADDDDGDGEWSGFAD